ncbi:MAG: ROK family protein [Solirubrobacteraceae bacterium]
MNRRFALGVDLGKTTWRCGAVSDAGTLATVHRQQAYRTSDPDALYASARDFVSHGIAAATNDVDVVGVATSGRVDASTGILIDGGGLPWVDYPLGPKLAEDCGLPVWVDNDANLGALAEAFYGAGALRTSVVYLTVSTGVGCGCVLEKQVLRGAHWGAGEIWELPVGLAGESVENTGSGRAIAARASSKFGLVTSTEDVFTRAAHGSKTAQSIIDEAVGSVAYACVWLCAVLDPDVIVVGGSVALRQDSYLDLVRSEAIRMSDDRKIELVRSALGDDAGLIGGGHYALRSRRNLEVQGQQD